MLTPALLFAALLTSQFVEGPIATGGACFAAWAPAGPPTNVAAASVFTYHAPANQRPKLGEAFYVSIHALSMSQPCATSQSMRVGLRLPDSLELADPPAGVKAVRAWLGPFGNQTERVVPQTPTAQLADGTYLFDPQNGLWSVPDSQQLIVDVLVRAVSDGSDTLVGYTDFALNAPGAAPLRPSVSTRVYFQPPAWQPSTLVADEIGSDVATVHGKADVYFSGGFLDVELRQVGTPAFETVARYDIDPAWPNVFVDEPLVDLAPDTAYEYRITVEVGLGSHAGDRYPSAVHTFRTLPPPTVSLTVNVDGEGTVVIDPPSADGRYDRGTRVTIRVVPNAGASLASWSINGAAIAAQSYELTLNSDTTVVARFVTDDVPVDGTPPDETPPVDGSDPSEGNDPIDDGDQDDGSDPSDGSVREDDEDLATDDAPQHMRRVGTGTGCDSSPHTDLAVVALATLLLGRRRRGTRREMLNQDRAQRDPG